ncbi:hypothetical protein [Shewanella xiamenensis]
MASKATPKTTSRALLPVHYFPCTTSW